MRIRAAVSAGPAKPLSLEDLELDEPRQDEVLVRIVTTGICQTDTPARNGFTPAPQPIVLGHEGAGVVERVGSAVTDLSPADHVVLSYQSCGRCPQCLSGRPAYCAHALAANFSGTRLDGTRGKYGDFYAAKKFGFPRAQAAEHHLQRAALAREAGGRDAVHQVPRLHGDGVLPHRADPPRLPAPRGRRSLVRRLSRRPGAPQCMRHRVHCGV